MSGSPQQRRKSRRRALEFLFGIEFDGVTGPGGIAIGDTKEIALIQLNTQALGCTVVELAYAASLCPTPASGVRFLGHHARRVTRRKVQSAFPGWIPEEWSA